MSMYAHSLICISYWTYEIEYCSFFLIFHAGDSGMLLHIYGKLTIPKLKSSPLSIELLVFRQHLCLTKRPSMKRK
jgi:hypothetical protein